MITYQQLNISQGGGGGSANLLINPRGKINQADEKDGVLSAGQYFCDGWKAGAGGAEVYRDKEGFRLISGSILQLVPNNIDEGRTLRANLDVLAGDPIININSAGATTQSDSGEFIRFEVSGSNSKFTRLILAESEELPIYQQQADELFACYRFLFVQNKRIHTTPWRDIFFPTQMIAIPAITFLDGSVIPSVSNDNYNMTLQGFHINHGRNAHINGYIADARP